MSAGDLVCLVRPAPGGRAQELRKIARAEGAAENRTIDKEADLSDRIPVHAPGSRVPRNRRPRSRMA